MSTNTKVVKKSDQKMKGVFNWRFYEDSEKELFHLAKKMAVISEVSIEEFLKDLINGYLNTKKNQLDFTPVNENELLEHIKGTDLEVTRPTLRKWRAKHNPVYKKVKLWYNNGFYIVYNLEAMKEFISDKKKNLVTNGK